MEQTPNANPNANLQTMVHSSSDASSAPNPDAWVQRCKEVLRRVVQPGVHRVHWPVEGKAIVHSNKLGLLLDACKETGHGHVFALDERGSTRDYKSYFMCENLQEFHDFIYSHPTEDRHFNEIIFGDWPCKAFFDIDVEKEREESVEAAKERVTSVQEDLIARFKHNVETELGERVTNVHVIYGDGYKANGETYKVSRHIVCDGVFFESIYGLGEFVRTFHAEDVEAGLDLAVYNKNRAFRLVGSSKVRDPARVLYLSDPEERVSFLEWSRLLVSAANADLDMLGEADYPVVSFGSSSSSSESERNVVKLLMDIGCFRELYCFEIRSTKDGILSKIKAQTVT